MWLSCGFPSLGCAANRFRPPRPAGDQIQPYVRSPHKHLSPRHGHAFAPKNTIESHSFFLSPNLNFYPCFCNFFECCAFAVQLRGRTLCQDPCSHMLFATWIPFCKNLYVLLQSLLPRPLGPPGQPRAAPALKTPPRDLPAATSQVPKNIV